jgi:crotonobetainyl-CoA:carnitine CoA-transferase CaiB-like acyl-CoA transferase
MEDAMLPLEGLSILAISTYGAGPFGTLHLADLGAEVIKIEDPETQGDISRYVVPHAIEQDSLFYQTFNRNKKSITLNLRVPEAVEVLRGLVKVSDVVFSNMRGDQPQKRGLTYEALKGINPKIVCVSLSGFGMTGPRMKEPGYDYIIQGLAGWMDLTGDPEGPPTKSGLSMVDYSTGVFAALAIMVGVYSAQRTGIGCDMDISLYDTAISLLTYPAVWYLNGNYVPKRMADSAHPTIVPSQNFRTRDGYMVVMCQKDNFWFNLCDALGRRDLAEDGRFKTLKDRYQHKDVLLPILKQAFMEKTTAEWIDVLTQKNVPCCPVNKFEDVFKEPHLAARNLIVEVDHPKFGKIKELACPVRVVGVDQKTEPAAAYGANTEEILKGLLDCDDQKIASLRSLGAI